MNDGCLRPIALVVPEGSMLNPRYPAAVVAGNVETSQVVTDALFAATGRLAPSQGTMNNFTFGNARDQYYETIAGGSGAGPDHDGTSAVQTHMTNSRLTDPEILETRLPVRLDQFAIRRGSGGPGAHKGGDGVVRAVTFLEPMRANILANRRRVPPRGIMGGGDAQAGRNWVERADGAIEMLSATASAEVAARRPLRDRNPRRRRVREERRMINYWPLLGIALVVIGFALRLNPLLVVAVAAIVDRPARRHAVPEGARHARARLQREPLRLDDLHRPAGDRPARALWPAAAGAGVIGKMRGATTGRLLIVYLGFRQIFAALGLTSVAGHAQTVRPLVAPMAVAAAEKQHGQLDEATAERVKAMSAATDNIGLFFGEDIFLAIASILLIQGSLASFGIQLTPFQLSVWAIPSAICAFVIHGSRLLWMDRQLSGRR